MTTKQPQYSAQKLLLEYRSAIWRKSAFEAVPGVGHVTLRTCMKQINLTQELVSTLRNNKLLGEKLYWIIYSSYMTDKQPCDVDEILSGIAQKHEYIPRRTYFRLRARAIKMMDAYLIQKASMQQCQGANCG